MAASESVNPVDLLCEQIAGASPDVLQAMIKTFAQAVMSAEADAICGAHGVIAGCCGLPLRGASRALARRRAEATMAAPSNGHSRSSRWRLNAPLPDCR